MSTKAKGVFDFIGDPSEYNDMGGAYFVPPTRFGDVVGYHEGPILSTLGLPSGILKEGQSIRVYEDYIVRSKSNG